jgi:hypothetical protein
MELAFLTPRTELTSLLEVVRRKYGGYQILDHWTQGEFHHDVVMKVGNPRPEIPGQILVLATNCNGGIKEVLCFDEVPDRWALWHFRCPENPEFAGELPQILGSTRTKIWYDPCSLLGDDGPSELKPEFRERMRGGGWCSANTKDPEGQ